MPDKTPVAFPTAGAEAAKSRNRGEKYPVVFVVPKGVHVGGKSIGSMKCRVDVGSASAFDPDEPFCRTSVESGETELFLIDASHRSKTTLKVDSAELAAALEDWAAAASKSAIPPAARAAGRSAREDGTRGAKTAPRTAAETPPAIEYEDPGDLDCRIAAAYLAAEIVERERMAARKKKKPF